MERMLDSTSDDRDRYAKMVLRLEPNRGQSLVRNVNYTAAVLQPAAGSQRISVRDYVISIDDDHLAI